MVMMVMLMMLMSIVIVGMRCFRDGRKGYNFRFSRDIELIGVVGIDGGSKDAKGRDDEGVEGDGFSGCSDDGFKGLRSDKVRRVN